MSGGVGIGSGYAGTNAAPGDGLIVEGKVGIGTNEPKEVLHIKGHFRLDGGQIKSWSPIIFHPDVDENGDDSIQFLNRYGSEIMRVHTNGNVGIGTSTPTEKLEVHGGFKIYSNNRSLTIYFDTHDNWVFKDSGSKKIGIFNPDAHGWELYP